MSRCSGVHQGGVVRSSQLLDALCRGNQQDQQAESAWEGERSQGGPRVSAQLLMCEFGGAVLEEAQAEPRQKFTWACDVRMCMGCQAGGCCKESGIPERVAGSMGCEA